MAAKTKQKRIITIYSLSVFGVATFRGNLLTLGESSLDFIPTGKRGTERRGINDKMLVLDGEFPDGPSGLDETGKTRYASFDPQYENEFHLFANKMVAENPGAVLIDKRSDAAKAMVGFFDGKEDVWID